MEGAAGGQRGRGRGLAGDRLQHRRRVQPGHAAQQGGRVGVPGVAEQRLHRGLLHDPPGIHHQHAVGGLGHHAQVVGDQDDRRPALPLPPPQHGQHLRLHRHVQRRGRLVGQDQPRVAGQRHRRHRPLPHAAGELVRVLPRPPRRIRDLHVPQQLHRPCPGRTPGHAPQRHLALDHLPPDRQHRVQRGRRVLEDEAGRLAPHPAQRLRPRRRHLHPAQPHRPAHPRRGGQQPARRQRRDALARARFAHDAQDLPGRRREVEPPHRLDPAGEADVQAADLEDGLAHRGGGQAITPCGRWCAARSCCRCRA